MYKLTEDYHVHTIYSDGKSTAEENVKQAIKMGLTTIGISDHCFNHRSAGINREDVAKLREEITMLQAKYPEIKILMGIEANLLNLKGELDLSRDDIKLFDYIIFGIHYLTFGKGVKGSLIFNIKNKFFHTKRHIEKVTDAYIKAMEMYPVKIVVHPNYVVPVNVARLCESASKLGVLVEFNGKRTTFSPEQVAELKASKAQFVIGSDAHHFSRVAEFSIPLKFIQDNQIPLDRIVNLKVEN